MNNKYTPNQFDDTFTNPIQTLQLFIPSFLQNFTSTPLLHNLIQLIIFTLITLITTLPTIHISTQIFGITTTSTTYYLIINNTHQFKLFTHTF